MTSELKRNITSFTGIVGSEKINDLCKIKNERKWNDYRERYEKLSRLEIIQNFPIQILMLLVILDVQCVHYLSS